MPNPDAALANRRTLNPTRRVATPTYGGAGRGDVATQGGRQGIVGKGGNFQPLGAAAQRRFAGQGPDPMSPAAGAGAAIPPPAAKPGLPVGPPGAAQGAKPALPVGGPMDGIQGEKPLMRPQGSPVQPTMAPGSQPEVLNFGPPNPGGPNPPQMAEIQARLARGIPPELMQRIQQLRTGQGGGSGAGGPSGPQFYSPGGLQAGGGPNPPQGMNGGGLQAGSPQMGGAAGPGGIVGPGAVAQPTPQPPAFDPWSGRGGAPTGMDAYYRNPFAF